MTIFDELMLLIDDQVEIKTDRIELFLPQYQRQTIGSTLGRLVGRNWLNRTEKASQTTYRLTKEGSDQVSQILDTIRRGSQVWDKTWFLVFVTLTEQERRERDIVRRYFATHGFGSIVDSCWLSPWNRQEEVNQLIRRLQISSKILTCSTQPFGQATQQMVIQYGWQWDAASQHMRDFLEKNKGKEEGVLRLSKEAQTEDDRIRMRFLAKSVVYDYGLTLVEDPNLPQEIMPASTVHMEASALYERIRTYCY